MDDILLAANDNGFMHDAKQFLSQNFDMKDIGEANIILDIQILRDQESIILSQSHYTKKSQ